MLGKYEFEYIDPFMCYAWVATAIVGAGVIGAASTAYAASKASDAQVQASQQAAQTQSNMYNQTNVNLAPYRNIGNQASDYTSQNLNSLIAPVNVDTSITNDPNSTIGQAYNFINTQGQRGVTNSAAARGLATSGAALKGAATFATGSADTFYNNLFNIGVTNQTNAYNRLQGLINTGENAAAGTGAAATATGQGVAASQTAVGNAQAAGINAAGTAVNSAAGTVPNAFLTAGLYGKLNGTSGNSFLPSGSSVPGAIGPTSVNGLPVG